MEGGLVPGTGCYVRYAVKKSQRLLSMWTITSMEILYFRFIPAFRFTSVMMPPSMCCGSSRCLLQNLLVFEKKKKKIKSSTFSHLDIPSFSARTLHRNMSFALNEWRLQEYFVLVVQQRAIACIRWSRQPCLCHREMDGIHFVENKMSKFVMRQIVVPLHCPPPTLRPAHSRVSIVFRTVLFQHRCHFYGV